MTDNKGFDNMVMIDDNSSGEISGLKSSGQKKNGVFISYPWLIVMVLGAVALSTLVGLIVHFAYPEKTCVCPTTAPETTPSSTPASTSPLPTSDDYMWDLCLNISAARNECFPCFLPTEPTPAPTVPTTVDYRLPATMIPSHYNIDLRPHFYDTDPQNFWFEGNVTIYLKCAEATSFIYLHTRDLTVSSVQVVMESSGENIEVRNTEHEETTEFFIITLARTLIVDREVTIAMSFQGPLRKDMYGLYFSDYEEGTEMKYMLVTQFQATSARKAFPCLDEPLYKATFNVSLQHLPEMVALNNMPNISYEVMDDGWIRSTFEETPILMPTYLQAFAISAYDFIDDYANTSIALSPKYLRHWARPEAVAADQLEWTKFITPPLFDFLENYFDHVYDLPKTDQIAISDFSAGAMENWGLITYTEVRLLVDPEYTPTTTIQRLTITIAHELLHQWLGNVVTCKWWSDLWTQEGMATYHQHEAVGYALPDWDMDELFTTTVVYLAMDFDSTGSAHPLTNYAAQSNSEISSMFSRITYEKGGSVIRMTRDFMGRLPFDEGMRNYVAKMQYGSAVEADLFASWEEQAPILDPSVGEILRSWTNQMGHPLVTFRRINGGTEVEVTQRMYLVDPEAPLVEMYPTRYGYTWHIPLTYQTSSNSATTRDWLNREDKNITLDTPLQDDQWILANIGHIGFYRVNYDDLTWAALIRQLDDDHTVIDRLSRGQLIYDSFYMARSGELDQLTGLNVIQYLSKEETYVPFMALTHAGAYLNGILSRYPQYPSYRSLVNNLFQPTLTRLGWDAPADEPLMTTYHRNLAIDTMCENDEATCVEYALEKFDEFVADPSNMRIIHQDHRLAFYCTAVRQRGEDAWEFIYNRYLVEKDDHEKPWLRDALSCTTQPWLLSRLFMLALEDDAFETDRNSILLSIARNRNANGLVWENLNAMWDTLPNRNGILSALTEYYSTEADFQVLLDFTAARATDMAGAEDAILRTVRANLRWAERNAEAVIDFLENLE